MSLKEARIQSAIVRGGIDPNPFAPVDQVKAFESKQENKLPDKIPTLREVAVDWFDIKKLGLSNGKHIAQKRTKEVRFVARQDVDLAAGVWCSRAEHMKMRREHRIPVSRQLDGVFNNMALLNNVPKETVFDFRTQDFVSVFARPSNKSGVIDENRACREIQVFHPDITGHGLRSAFRTWARKQNCYDLDVMEYALAHEKNSLVAAYFREDLLEERREMMQNWADYLTGGKDVPSLKMVPS